ncbi:rhombosortase-dependent M36 family metallopeptidase [Glaciecola sp. MH2013]|uniref:rhombosortase-dependent M36 family metallopeptidase n=1 Tax=Glaciecola sp. MH2013 TaxID=2785524 RepID=UPI00189DAB17|nr:rhombosortase-dependent M36 family metallopeptidase [Glaciecola sp. MH2013]MBF7074562.1 rhombosortase-dependent M36 family metallopeptidase [Glaciecola sp. MH2013]
MKIFKPTLIAATVTMALGSLAVNAVPASEVINIGGNYASQAFTSYDASAQQALAAQPTVSGMKSQFDASLGKATFVWAPQNMRAPNLSNVAPSAQPKAAANHYLNALTGVSVNKGGVSQAILSSFHDMGKGTRIAKYTQEVSGIEVFNREMNVMLNSEMNLVAASGYFSQNLLPQGQIAPDSNFGSAQKAIEFALSNAAEQDVSVSFGDSTNSGKYEVFNAQISEGNIDLGMQPRAKKVYFDSNKGLRASYYVEVDIAEADSVNGVLYGYVVDAVSGKILHKHRMTSDDSAFHYRAYAQDDLVPMQGPHGKVLPALTPGNDPTEILDAPLVTVESMPFFSRQDPWLPEDATTVSGNNAFAYADVIAPQGFSLGDFTAEVTSVRTFDYVIDESQRANSLNNRKAAIVNLFYMTNYLHNYYYDFGFDEASGNAQLSNFGRGGVENDPLLLEAQDNSGLNNANMSTPADGASPRMQQFLWTDKDAVVGEDWGIMVTTPDELGVLGTSQLASFGPQQYSDVAGAVVRIDDGDDADGAASVNDGCQPAVNIAELAGNIAIIDRGACAFTTKVLNAQNAGAIGAIIVNNTDDGTPAPMGGSDDTVFIASQGLSFQDGASLYDIIDADGTAEVSMFSTFPLKDSTFDNAIIAHEFGHYIQNRLIGNASGLNNFQGRAMGEGWADVHAMIFVTQEEDLLLPGNEEFAVGYGVGTYVTDFFRGIRRAPYSSDLDVNPFSFEHITTGAGPAGFPATSNLSPHGAGEIWAVSLWDFYVSLINTHGFDEAKARISRYIVEGYKLTPVSPLYTEARDAILAAAIANDQGDFDLALAAFAKRGMGLGAVSPDRFSTNLSGVVPSNLTELAAYSAVDLDLNTNFDGETVGFCSDDGVLDIGETGTLTVTIANSGSEMLSGITAQVIVQGDADITLENDGLITFDDLAPFTRSTSAPIQVTINDAAIAEDVAFVVVFPEAMENDEIVEPLPVGISTSLNFSFEKVDPVGGEATDDMEDGSSVADWTPNAMVGGEDAINFIFDTVNTPFFQGGNPRTDLGARTIRFIDSGFETDVAYESSTMEVGFQDNFSISFWHAYLFETGFDGGVVELSVNGSDWADVTAFGGQFDFGYNAVLDPAVEDQPLAGRGVFTGRNFAPADGGREVINFGTTLNGSEVRFRFRMATDSSGSDFGWFVDNVTFTNIDSPVFSEVTSGETASCDNSAPRLDPVSGTAAVDERSSLTLSASAQDRNTDDTISYSWTQTAGIGVQMTGADTATMSFTAPSVSLSSQIEFTVTASDGMASDSQTWVVTVNNLPEPPAEEASLRSSGSMGWIALLLAPIAFLRRRKK